MAEANGVGALTEAEQKYLDSGGQDSAGLVAELQPKTNGADAPAAPAPAPAKAADEGKPDAATPPAAPPDAAAQPAAAAAAAVAAEEPEVGEEDVATPDGKGKRRMVDSRALKAARTRTKELESKLEEERQARVKDNEARAVVNERLRLLTEAVSTPAADPAAAAETETPPDPQEDIFGYATYLGKQVEELTGKLGQVTEQTAEERAAAQTVNSFRADAGAFARQQPDFMDAYNHLFRVRKEQLEEQKYTPAEVSQWLFREEMHLIDRALKAGRSPAQQIYALSKTMGYAPKAPPPPPADAVAAAAAAQANGHAAPPAAAAPALSLAPAAAAPAANVSDEIDRIKAGQSAARSLSNGSGGGGDELSIEALANMPMADFEKLVKSKAGAVERALGRTN